MNSNLLFLYPSFSDEDLSVIKKYIREGDWIVFSGLNNDSIRRASSFKSERPDITVCVGFNSIYQIENLTAQLPANIDYVAYDYEKALSPEFTRDMLQSIEFFDRARNIANEYGKKLIITPGYFEEWDYGEVAKHTDAINIQTQMVILREPAMFEPVVKNLVNQIKTESPDTILFIQVSLLRFSVEDNYYYIKKVENSGIDGVVVWYSSEQIDQLKDFFKIK